MLTLALDIGGTKIAVGLVDPAGELVQLAPGYEHPGDPRQPDNTHRH